MKLKCNSQTNMNFEKKLRFDYEHAEHDRKENENDETNTNDENNANDAIMKIMDIINNDEEEEMMGMIRMMIIENGAHNEHEKTWKR